MLDVSTLRDSSCVCLFEFVCGCRCVCAPLRLCLSVWLAESVCLSVLSY